MQEVYKHQCPNVSQTNWCTRSTIVISRFLNMSNHSDNQLLWSLRLEYLAEEQCRVGDSIQASTARVELIDTHIGKLHEQIQKEKPGRALTFLARKRKLFSEVRGLVSQYKQDKEAILKVVEEETSACAKLLTETSDWYFEKIRGPSTLELCESKRTEHMQLTLLLREGRQKCLKELFELEDHYNREECEIGVQPITFLSRGAVQALFAE